MLWHRRQQQSDDAAVNVTPLIDVSLVLVVILLLATPLAFESSIGVKSPDRSGRKAMRDDKSARVELTLVDEDNVRVNRTLVARSDLMATLKPMIDQSDERVVTVACAEEISHGAFVDVLDKAKRCGAAGIAVSGR
jgi:biopolymer transport protein ExbD